MYAFLASMIPTVAALLVGVWLLAEQVARKTLRDRLVKLEPRRSEIRARHREGMPSTRLDQADLDARTEWEQLLRDSGIRPERLNKPTYSSVVLDQQVGHTIPWSEVSRQLILIVGALAGIVFLGLDLQQPS